jgi:hypothetical protein
VKLTGNPDSGRGAVGWFSDVIEAWQEARPPAEGGWTPNARTPRRRQAAGGEMTSGDVTVTSFYHIPLPGGGQFCTRLELDEGDVAATTAAFERAIEQVIEAGDEISRDDAIGYLQASLAHLDRGEELLVTLEEFDSVDALEAVDEIEQSLS